MNDLKDLKGIAGIYCLKNEVNGKVYVGLSVDLARRLREHYNLSQSDKSNYLYNAIRKYGVDNFSVSILEITEDVNSLLNLEAKWIQELDSCNKDKGYNVRIETGETYKHSEETKLKISEARQGYVMPDVHKAKLEHTFYKQGEVPNIDVIDKRRLALKQAWADGKFADVDFKANSGSFIRGQKSPMKGKTTADETKLKQSIAKKGRAWTDAQRAGRTLVDTCKKVYQFTLDNVYVDVFDSAKAVEVSTNGEYKLPGVMKNCNGGSNYYKDFVFKYEDDIILIDDETGVKTFIYKDGKVPNTQSKTRATRTVTTYKKKNNYDFRVSKHEDIV